PRTAKNAHLPALALTLDRSRALERLIQHRGQLGSARLRGIERADLDQAFQDALVDLAQIDTLAEIQERAEPAGLIPGRDDGLDRSLTDILDGGEAEADSVLHDRKVFLALVRIRREHTDAKVAAFREIADHLVGVPHLARQQRSEELGGKMRLEIRGLVGNQRVGGGMRVVDDHAVRDEISVFFNSKVIRLLFPASVDGDNPIPEDVRRSDVLKTLTAKE